MELHRIYNERVYEYSSSFYDASKFFGEEIDKWGSVAEENWNAAIKILTYPSGPPQSRRMYDRDEAGKIVMAFRDKAVERVHDEIVSSRSTRSVGEKGTLL